MLFKYLGVLGLSSGDLVKSPSLSGCCLSLFWLVGKLIIRLPIIWSSWVSILVKKLPWAGGAGVTTSAENVPAQSTVQITGTERNNRTCWRHTVNALQKYVIQLMQYKNYYVWCLCKRFVLYCIFINPYNIKLNRNSR